MNLQSVLLRLGVLPTVLRDVADGLTESAARQRGSRHPFALVEQVWHLADLEAEGFQVRIRRLLEEQNPLLADFEGDRIARERRYIDRRLTDGLQAFAQSRSAVLAALRAMTADQWLRSGVQEHVGPITLDSLPAAIAAHDRSHLVEISDLLSEIQPDHAALPAVVALASDPLPSAERI